MGWSKFHRDFTSIIADAWHVSVVQAATHGFPLHLENNTWRSGTVQAVHVNGGNDTIFRSLTLTLDTGNLGHVTVLPRHTETSPRCTLSYLRVAFWYFRDRNSTPRDQQMSNSLTSPQSAIDPARRPGSASSARRRSARHVQRHMTVHCRPKDITI